jgi:hypothetical protein
LRDGRRPTRSKLTTKELKRLDYCIAEMLKAWDDRFDPADPKFLERYLRGEICIHAHFGGSDESGAEKFCATFYGPQTASAPILRNDLDFALLEYVAAETDRVVDDGIAADDQEKLVLIDVVQVMKDGERMFVRNGAVVRLRPLDDCLRAAGDSLYCSLLDGLFIFRDSSADGEMNPERGRMMPPQNESPRQMVQAGPKVGNNLASPNGEIERRVRWTRNAIDILRKVTVYLFRWGVRIESKELLNKRIEPLDIVVGPLDLRPTPFEWRGDASARLIHDGHSERRSELKRGRNEAAI